MSNPSSYVPDIQVPAEHYRPSAYLSPERMASIGWQIRLVHEHFPQASILEIGGGGGLARQLLEQDGHKVLPLDLDPQLKPHVQAALPDLPIRSQAFDMVLCCQVLEHMPWDAAKLALREIARVGRQGAVISIPTVRHALALTIYEPLRERAKYVELPFSLGRNPIRWKSEHLWELEAGVRSSQFEAACRDAGFTIARSFRPMAFLYHHFFVLQKR